MESGSGKPKADLCFEKSKPSPIVAQLETGNVP